MPRSQNFDNGMVYYESFINQLNWRCNPVAPGTVPCEYSGNLEVDWFSVVTGGSLANKGNCQVVLKCFGVDRVRHNAMVADLTDTSVCT